jgi:hypothetical protein
MQADVRKNQDSQNQQQELDNIEHSKRQQAERSFHETNYNKQKLIFAKQTERDSNREIQKKLKKEREDKLSQSQAEILVLKEWEIEHRKRQQARNKIDEKNIIDQKSISAEQAKQDSDREIQRKLKKAQDDKLIQIQAEKQVETQLKIRNIKRKEAEKREKDRTAQLEKDYTEMKRTTRFEKERVLQLYKRNSEADGKGEEMATKVPSKPATPQTSYSTRKRNSEAGDEGEETTGSSGESDEKEEETEPAGSRDVDEDPTEKAASPVKGWRWPFSSGKTKEATDTAKSTTRESTTEKESRDKANLRKEIIANMDKLKTVRSSPRGANQTSDNKNKQEEEIQRVAEDAAEQAVNKITKMRMVSRGANQALTTKKVGRRGKIAATEGEGLKGKQTETKMVGNIAKVETNKKRRKEEDAATEAEKLPGKKYKEDFTRKKIGFETENTATAEAGKVQKQQTSEKSIEDFMQKAREKTRADAYATEQQLLRDRVKDASEKIRKIGENKRAAEKQAAEVKEGLDKKMTKDMTEKAAAREADELQRKKDKEKLTSNIAKNKADKAAQAELDEKNLTKKMAETAAAKAVIDTTYARALQEKERRKRAIEKQTAETKENFTKKMAEGTTAQAAAREADELQRKKDKEKLTSNIAKNKADKAAQAELDKKNVKGLLQTLGEKTDIKGKLRRETAQIEREKNEPAPSSIVSQAKSIVRYVQDTVAPRDAPPTRTPPKTPARPTKARTGRDPSPTPPTRAPPRIPVPPSTAPSRGARTRMGGSEPDFNARSTSPARITRDPISSNIRVAESRDNTYQVWSTKYREYLLVNGRVSSTDTISRINETAFDVRKMAWILKAFLESRVVYREPWFEDALKKKADSRLATTERDKYFCENNVKSPTKYRPFIHLFFYNFARWCVKEGKITSRGIPVLNMMAAVLGHADIFVIVGQCLTPLEKISIFSWDAKFAKELFDTKEPTSHIMQVRKRILNTTR